MRSLPSTSALVVALGAAAAALAACGSTERTEQVVVRTITVEPGPNLPRRASAHVQPTKGSTARGVLWFAATDGGVRVTGEIGGLSPNGVHAIHLHECGDCSADDGMSAGGHYNPEGHPHAGPDAEMHHAGDLGNLHADASGVARMDLLCDDLSIAGPRNAVIGRSVIVHVNADDFTTQPTGNAGGRIGCGVVGVAKDEPAK